MNLIRFSALINHINSPLQASSYKAASPLFNLPTSIGDLKSCFAAWCELTLPCMTAVSAMRCISTVTEMAAQPVCNDWRAQNMPYDQHQLLLCQHVPLMLDKHKCAESIIKPESKELRVMTAQQKTRPCRPLMCAEHMPRRVTAVLNALQPRGTSSAFTNCDPKRTST